MKDRWISVKDKLPDKLPEVARSVRVLVFSENGQSQRVESCWYIEGEMPQFSGDITHWQLLPANPILGE